MKIYFQIRYQQMIKQAAVTNPLATLLFSFFLGAAILFRYPWTLAYVQNITNSVAEKQAQE